MTAAPFRLTPVPVPERDIHEACVEALNTLLLPPAFFFSAAIGATTLTPQQAAALSRHGVKRGLPDLLILAPPGIYGIELKRARGGRLSKTRIVRTRRGSPRLLEGQEDTFPRLEAAGMTIAIAHSVVELLQVLQGWNIPLRSHYR